MADTEERIQEFVGLVLSNLAKNGFPDQAVSFPLEKMYQSASQRGFSFNKIRDLLKQQGIDTELTEDRVIFSEALPADDPDAFDLQSAAQQIFQHMSPEERAGIARMMQDIPVDQVESLKRQWESMSADEKEERMAQLQKFTQQP